MSLIADILLVAAALGATFYCVVLSRRLSKFTDLEKGVGGAIAVLSAQVDDMTKTLRAAQGSASASASSLEGLTGRAEDAARRLELLVASMHDLPSSPADGAGRDATPRKGSEEDHSDDADGAEKAEAEADQDKAMFKAMEETALFSSKRSGTGNAS